MPATPTDPLGFDNQIPTPRLGNRRWSRESGAMRLSAGDLKFDEAGVMMANNRIFIYRKDNIMLSDAVSQHIDRMIRTNENWRRNYGCLGERTIVTTFNLYRFTEAFGQDADNETVQHWIDRTVDLWELEPSDREIRGNDEIEKLRELMALAGTSLSSKPDSPLSQGLIQTFSHVEDYLQHLSHTAMIRNVNGIVHVWLRLRALVAAEKTAS